MRSTCCATGSIAEAHMWTRRRAPSTVGHLLWFECRHISSSSSSSSNQSSLVPSYGRRHSALHARFQLLQSPTDVCVW
jgi:hypothetical protein